MLCRVALVRADVSEERSISIIRATKIGDLGTSAVCHVPPKRRFLQASHDVMLQKTAFFIVTAVKTWNLTDFIRDCHGLSEVIFWHLSEETVKTTKNLSQVSQSTSQSVSQDGPCPGRESNRGLLEYESIVLPLKPLNHPVWFHSCIPGTFMYITFTFHSCFWLNSLTIMHMLFHTLYIRTLWFSVCKQTILTERAPLVGEFLCRLSRIMGVSHGSFLDRSRYFFFQVAPHLSSWG
jgi:hypothetical protein